MADLWERLKAAQARVASSASEPQPTEKAHEEPAPAGWSWASALVAERRVAFSLEPSFWNAVAGRVDPAAWEGVLCFDTETTGLSGGAGTVAFLVGWASLTPAVGGGTPGVEVRQWFLRDLPGEPELIDALDRELAAARGLVSFNGASYDLPLLRSRWALAGRTFPTPAHRDDLPRARRLWKRLLDSCRLSQIEQAVLGLNRLDDVPGALVPALWFDYLRRGASADFVTPLEGVLRHHAQDVYSLLCLDLLIAALAASPDDERWEPRFARFPNRPSMARLASAGLLHPSVGPRIPVDFWGLLALRTPDSADRSLEMAWREEPSEGVGLAWADRLKRRRDPRARLVWTALWEQTRSYPALEELLKWLEHKDKGEPARIEALALVDEALKAPFLPRLWRERLEKRRARLAKSDRPAPSPT